MKKHCRTITIQGKLAFRPNSFVFFCGLDIKLKSQFRITGCLLIFWWQQKCPHSLTSFSSLPLEFDRLLHPRVKENAYPSGAICFAFELYGGSFSRPFSCVACSALAVFLSILARFPLSPLVLTLWYFFSFYYAMELYW